MNFTTISEGEIIDSDSYLNVDKGFTLNNKVNDSTQDNIWGLNSMFNAVDLGVLLLDSMGCIKTFNLPPINSARGSWVKS
jgi:hypothetical protein